MVDGYADLDPGGRPGLGAHAHGEFAVLVIGLAKSAFRTASQELVRLMAGRFRVPDALRRADELARTSPPTATQTGHHLG